MGSFLLAAAAFVLRGVVGQFPGMPGMPTEARPVAKTANLIQCAVCKLATQEVWDQTEAARAAAPGGRLGEDEIQEIASDVCNVDVDGGEWISFYDIAQTEAGSPIKLNKQEYLGECRRDCRTIVKACRAVYDEFREDVAESALMKTCTCALEAASVLRPLQTRCELRRQAQIASLSEVGQSLSGSQGARVVPASRRILDACR